MADWTTCAGQHQHCDFAGQYEVRYGAPNRDKWTEPRIFTDGVDCNNDVFGDPAYGDNKICQIRPYVPPVTAEPGPTPTPTPTTQPSPLGGFSTTTWLLIGGAILLLMGSGGGGRRR